MVSGLGVDIRPFIPAIVSRGGHMRVGLEEAPFGTPTTNPEWVESAVSLVKKREAGPPAPPISGGPCGVLEGCRDERC
jgi:3-keto-5-aminohexanoate cleavage enzyme